MRVHSSILSSRIKRGALPLSRRSAHYTTTFAIDLQLRAPDLYFAGGLNAAWTTARRRCFAAPHRRRKPALFLVMLTPARMKHRRFTPTPPTLHFITGLS